MGNLLNAAENGLKHGAIGYLITDWGDNGHHQPLPVSYLGFSYGAAVSWNLQNNRDIDIARAISLHLFRDPTGAAGNLAYETGNVYRLFETRTHNATAYALGTLRPVDQLNIATNTGEIKRAQREIDRLERAVAKLDLQRDDADLVRRELLFELGLMRYGTQRIALSIAKEKDKRALTAGLRPALRQLTAEYRRVWLARNRPGGLEDSIQKLKL
jgi:hypothetical protein